MHTHRVCFRTRCWSPHAPCLHNPRSPPCHQHTPRIIHFTIDNDPAFVFFIVLLDLLVRELLLLFTSLLLYRRDLVLHTGLHPTAVRSTWLDRIAEEDRGRVGVIVLHNGRLEDILAVVHHPHDVPVRLLGLGALEHVEAAHRDALRLQKVGDLDIDVPVQPCPEFVTVASGRLRMQYSHVSPSSSDTSTRWTSCPPPS
jgi:hypothetical protein